MLRFEMSTSAPHYSTIRESGGRTIELEADTEIRDEDKHTPLHYAAQYGHLDSLDIVKFMIGEQCQPNSVRYKCKV